MAEPVEPGLNIWSLRALGPDGVPSWFAIVQSSRHRDGAVVELPENQAREAARQGAISYARIGPDSQVTRLEATERFAPKAPPLWYAELKEPSKSPPATNLVAFSGHGVDPGTFLDRKRLREVGVTDGDQLAAFRWYPDSGFADQLYVAPQWRRHTIGSAILAAAGALGVARGWPRLWTDGQRTSDGERMRAASSWTHLTQELSHLRPPMTPAREQHR